jgi:hypothetical protein
MPTSVAPHTASGARRAAKPVLDPVERISEVLFGLIMALTFPGAISAAQERGEIRTLLVGALTCNVAWGMIDAAMHRMACLTERGAARPPTRRARAPS